MRLPLLCVWCYCLLHENHPAVLLLPLVFQNGPQVLVAGVCGQDCLLHMQHQAHMPSQDLLGLAEPPGSAQGVLTARICKDSFVMHMGLWSSQFAQSIQIVPLTHCSQPVCGEHHLFVYAIMSRIWMPAVNLSQTGSHCCHWVWKGS